MLGLQQEALAALPIISKLLHSECSDASYFAVKQQKQFETKDFQSCLLKLLLLLVTSKLFTSYHDPIP